jgi:putative heme-binding domain-containing protein
MHKLPVPSPRRFTFGGLLLALFLAVPLVGDTTAVQSADPPKAPEKFEIKPNDHICIIGNTLADRMQHDGWLETYFHSRFPKHDLVFRNLGFSGDELNLRLRSQSFGTPDEWLAGSAPCPEPKRLVTRVGVRDNRFETTNTKADVVFAFFGYNESFAGKAGLEQFKKDLDAFILHTLAQKYNSKSNPRLVVFSPVAHENLKDPNLPDGKENNARLEMYTDAMAEVAKNAGVAFVDLYHPTRDQYAKADKPLTINGVHLNERGNEAVAKVIDQALFPKGDPPARDAKALEKLRHAVMDKNFIWFNRYRVMDGYNVYGGRAFEKYAGQQSNYEDQQRELEIMDVMTGNREKRVWAVAQGNDFKVDDSNAPPLIPVKSNLAGARLENLRFQSGEDAIQSMTVAKGMKVTLFASEKEFPELAKPVQMQFDPQGRLWVAVWPSYPHWKPTEERNDKILIFEDTKGTGKADKMTVFADHLNCPTGFDFYNGGVLVAQAPDLLFLKDTKGAGKADLSVRVLHGLDSADSHHTSNSFTLDPGGALYFQEGTFHHTQVESPYGPPTRCVNAGVFRYEPRAQKFDTYVTYGFANPHGHVFNRWGQDIVVDGTGAQPYDAALFSGHLDYPQKHAHPPQVYPQRTRPCPGMEVLTSKHFPAEMQGNLLVANVIGFQGILQYQVKDKDSSLAGTEVETILSSTDANFRPSDLKIGPDGAIWFIDWHNPIIGHLQHAIRDPNRDRTHGRIYRITYEKNALDKPVPIAGQPIEKLLDLLKEPEDRVRYRTRIELGGRDTAKVIAAAKKWQADLDKKDPEYEHHRLEALWLHQAHNVVDLDLLKQVLASPEFHARAAATRVLCYWRDRVPEALELLKRQAADDNPRVRLEAIRAASFFTEPEAIEVALIANDRGTDKYLDFVRSETKRALDPIVSKALKEGKEIKFTTPAGSRYFLQNVNTDDLLKMRPRTQGVYLELLFRKGVRDEFRREALTGLAGLEKKSELRVLLDTIAKQDDQGGNQEESVVFDLVRLMTDREPKELTEARADLVKLATTGKTPLTRELGYVSLIAADGSPDKAWELALKSLGSLQDLVNAMPLVRDFGQRAALYPKIEPLLKGLPKELADKVPNANTTMGRYVRIDLAGRNKTLTLAEVEVYSAGRNIARDGKASQSSTANGGDAAKAIDGNKSGKYGDGGQTHTEENSTNPWWEVDLGAEFPIETIVIYNRTEDSLGKRLDGFELRVLDKTRKAVIDKKRNPAPEVKATFEIGSDAPEHVMRRAAMIALTAVRGKEPEAFKSIAPFIKDEAERPAALQALLRIPASNWPKDEAKPLLDTLLAYIKKVPATERTSPVALDALQLADGLATLLPLDDAKKVRKELGELGVRVIRLATVVEQMRYDKERFAVKAGKPVEVVLENVDLMPHNFVVTQIGEMQTIGELAEAQATLPGAADRQYVPNSPKVLVKSRLIQPRETEKISFVAPKEPGVYPYVCTYPGHWRRMYGAMYVVEDLDEYLANPEGYLAKNPLPVKDELLKWVRPRTEWKFDDLKASVEEMKSGRSYANGKQLFQVAACVSCHKFNGAGTDFGPDLAKLDPKQQKPEEILHDIIDPSFRINEKYFQYTFDLKSGKQVTGMILEEKNNVVKVIENPLVKTDPLILKVSDIDMRTKSNVSIMPKGLLDKLTREEILDLVAYVMSKGEQSHPLFKGENGHHH